MAMQQNSSAGFSGSTVDPAEVAKFSKLSDEWWDPKGKMAPLHKINPLRLAYIRDAACRKFERNTKSLSCLSGLRILDIGCGAGLLCEPFTRLGAQVIGIDPSATNIAAARLHADKGHLSIDYRCTTVEEMDVRERFDIVLAMEVIEHVTDVGAFLARCAAVVKPGGLMVVSTLNRNWKSFALAIVGAEYVLRWLPRGTHQWDKFVTPDELAQHLATQQAHHHRTGRRGLQPARRPMEHLVRHGRELHGGGRGGVSSQDCRSSLRTQGPIPRCFGYETSDHSCHTSDARYGSLRSQGRRWYLWRTRNPVMTPVRLTAPIPTGTVRQLPAGISPCSPSPRSGFPSPSSLRWARSPAMRCSGR